MKKQLLIVLTIIPAYIFAQKSTPAINPKNDLPFPGSSDFVGFDLTTSLNKSGATYTPKLNKHVRYSGVPIGKTFYDLQTNASVGRRLILHDDGKISAVWTTAAVTSTDFNDRGTGYNHKSTDWLALENSRFETQRTGWPCIGVLKNGATKYEFVMGHMAVIGGWILSKNTAIGSTDFSNQTPVLQQLNDKAALWGRVGTNGDKIIHLVSNYNYDPVTGKPVQVKINGVISPSTYSRSLDAGATWDKQFTTMPGYDSTRIVSGGGDNYAIDVKDSIVAIVIGGLAEDVILYKSTNNGNTFSRIVVEEFAFAPMVTANKHLITADERAKSSDGSFDVIIDNTNKVHVFFGRSAIADDDTTEDGWGFYPQTAQLIHWAEGWDSVNVCGGAKDYDGSGTLDINAETFANLDNGNLPTNLSGASRYGATSSLVTFPSSSIDANGNLYVIYSAPDELAISGINSNFRDVYVSYSTDNGHSWTIGQNITASASLGFESVFASAAKRSDNFLHFIYQEDQIPGTNLQNNGNSNTHPNQINDILYKAIPVADILADLVLDPTSVQKVTNDPKIFFVSQNQPNPFNSETQAMIYMRDGSDLNLTVNDIAGKVIRNENLGYHSAGNHNIAINADGLSSGIYLYTITNNQYSITKKMQVK